MLDALIRWLYSQTLRLLTPVYLARLWWKGRKEPVYRKRIGERLGRYAQKPRRGRGGVVWVHAVSLGETRAAGPLIKALREELPEMRLLLTCSTATGVHAGLELLEHEDDQAWFPYDTPGAVRRFLKRYRPAVGATARRSPSRPRRASSTASSASRARTPTPCARSTRPATSARSRRRRSSSTTPRAPPAPTGFTVSPTRLPRLTWDAMADDDTGASGIDHYEVFRDGTLVGTSTTTSFDDGSVPTTAPTATRCGRSTRRATPASPRAAATVQVDATDPPPPADVTGITPTKVPALSWQPVTDATTGGSPIARLPLYRDGLFVGESTTASYVDGKLQVSGQFVYTVRALDAAGNVSGPSAGREIILDAEGPVLDGVSFPQRAIAGSAVEFTSDRATC